MKITRTNSFVEIRRISSFDELDKAKFRELVESGFGKRLVDWYFDYCSPEYICLAVEEDAIYEGAEAYVGAIVVERIPDSEIYYLDKIVVSAQHQGKGIGGFLWNELNGSSSKLVWRAKKDNPFNGFYEEQSDGKLSFPELPDYFIYYYGLNQEELGKAVKYAAEKKPTLE